MAYMCKKNDICIGTLHIHLRPSLRASTIPGMASPIISLLSSSCDLIGGWKGEAHCRGRKERSGEHTHTHNQPHSYPPPTHTGNPSFLLFTTRPVFSYTPLLNYSQHKQLRRCWTADMMRCFWASHWELHLILPLRRAVWGMYLPKWDSHQCVINREVSGSALMVMHSYAFTG